MTSTMSNTHHNMNFNMEQKSKLQKAFGQPHSVREYSRIPKSKIANTGYDPSGVYQEFISKDVIRPLSRQTIYPPLLTIGQMGDRNERWALETVKTCSNIDHVPKFQQFKDYNFPKRSRDEIDKYREVFLKTDHVAIKVPKTGMNQGNDDKATNKYSFLKMKGEYGSFSETKNSWAPYKPLFTAHNTSSMKYNILTFEPTPNYCGSQKMVDKNLFAKQKGVAEYSDLTRTYRTNVNKDFRKAYDDNKNTFYIYNGIFSNMYDACHRNGNLSVPFKSGGMKINTKHKDDGNTSNNNN